MKTKFVVCALIFLAGMYFLYSRLPLTAEKKHKPVVSAPAKPASAKPEPTPEPEPRPVAHRVRRVVSPPAVVPLEPSSAHTDWHAVFEARLNDGNPEVRASVIDCVIGLDAVDALPIVVFLMTDPNEHIVAQPAGKALVRLGEKAIQPLIETGLKSGEEQFMDRSSMVLCRIGNSAVDALINVLSNPNERVRYYAKKALFYIGAESGLVEVVRRDGDPVRTAEAYDVLRWISSGKFVANWGPVSGPATTYPRTEAVELRTELAEAREKLYESKYGKVVYIDGVDKLVPATMSSRTFNLKLMSLPPKERLAVMKAREAYFKAMREP